MDSNLKIRFVNGCLGLIILCVNISDIVIITFKYVNYSCIIHEINKSEVAHLQKDSVFEDCGYIQKCISKKSIIKIESKTFILKIQYKEKKRLKTF